MRSEREWLHRRADSVHLERPVHLPVLPRLRCTCLLFGAAAVLAAATGLQAADPAVSYPWQERVWQKAAELQVDDAMTHLPDRRKAGSDDERRQIDFTRAVLLLNVQPKLPGNIDEARMLLESVRQTRADDDAGLSALYYLARIAQFHAESPDPAKAATLYGELIQRAPDHPLAQEAVARLAALQLYADISPDERRTCLSGFEAAAARLTLPGARRDANFVLADACLLFSEDKAGGLRHLLAAEEAGISRQQLAGDTMAKIAILARDTGQRDVAIEHYRRFLAAYQRDGRAYTLAQQLKELEAQQPPATDTPPPVSATPTSAETPVATPVPAP